MLEAEFVGKSRGHEFREFCAGIDEKLTSEQKIAIWMRQTDLQQATLLYSKVNSISMLPPGSDMKLFKFDTNTASDPTPGMNNTTGPNAVMDGVFRAVGATQG
jgi:hypothetical protein